MTHRKTYHVQAMSNADAMLIDVTVNTRKAERLAMSEALQAASDNGGGYMRRQTEGAKGWAVYVIEPGARIGYMALKDQAATINARFDLWTKTGGTMQEQAA